MKTICAVHDAILDILYENLEYCEELERAIGLVKDAKDMGIRMEEGLHKHKETIAKLLNEFDKKDNEIEEANEEIKQLEYAIKKLQDEYNEYRSTY